MVTIRPAPPVLQEGGRARKDTDEYDVSPRYCAAKVHGREMGIPEEAGASARTRAALPQVRRVGVIGRRRAPRVRLPICEKKSKHPSYERR